MKTFITSVFSFATKISLLIYPGLTEYQKLSLFFFYDMDNESNVNLVEMKEKTNKTLIKIVK